MNRQQALDLRDMAWNKILVLSADLAADEQQTFNLLVKIQVWNQFHESACRQLDQWNGDWDREDATAEARAAYEIGRSMIADGTFTIANVVDLNEHLEELLVQLEE